MAFETLLPLLPILAQRPPFLDLSKPFQPTHPATVSPKATHNHSNPAPAQVIAGICILVFLQKLPTTAQTPPLCR